MAEPKSLSYVPEPTPGSLELQCRALEKGPSWPQEALGVEASESSQGPQGGGSGCGHSKKPPHPSFLSPSSSWPPQGWYLQQSPWSLEELGGGRQKTHKAVSVGTATWWSQRHVTFSHPTFTPSPSGRQLHPCRCTKVLLSRYPHTGTCGSPAPSCPFPSYWWNSGSGGEAKKNYPTQLAEG